MIDVIIFGWMVTWGIAFAMTLQWTEEHWQLVTRETWIMVFLGTTITLLFLSLIDMVSGLACWKCWAGFACTGVPVITRSIVNRFVRNRNMREETIKRATPRA